MSRNDRGTPDRASGPPTASLVRSDLGRGPDRPGRGAQRALAVTGARDRQQAATAREALVEAPVGRRERAGKGVAHWGRHRLAADSVEALRATGAFRTVPCDDLAAGFESRARGRRALGELEAAGLIAIESFQRGSVRLATVSLTRRGKRLLERCIDPRESGDECAQPYRAGPARGSQILHDAAVYRAAQREIRKLQARGGRVIRIGTEEDLQARAARLADSARRSGVDPRDARAQAAAALHLAEHGGRLVFPDVRIEYADPAEGTGRQRFVDVEVVTPEYRQAALQAKAAAGFCVYRMKPDGSLSA